MLIRKETQGVPVTTVGKSIAFPAFYTPDSGHEVRVTSNVHVLPLSSKLNTVPSQSPCNVSDAAAAARMIRKWISLSNQRKK